MIQFSPFMLLPVDNFVSVSVNKCMYFKIIPVLKLSNCCDYLGRLGDVILPLVVAFGVGLAGSSCWESCQRVLI